MTDNKQDLATELLKQLKADTEEYVDHDQLIEDGEKYSLIIALKKFIDRYY